MFNLKFLLFVFIGFTISVSAAYGIGRYMGVLACDARHKIEALDDYKRRVEEGESIAAAFEMDLAGGRDFYRDLERQVANEIQSNNIYNSCVLPGSGLYLANSALAGKPAR